MRETEWRWGGGEGGRGLERLKSFLLEQSKNTRVHACVPLCVCVFRTRHLPPVPVTNWEAPGQSRPRFSPLEHWERASVGELVASSRSFFHGPMAPTDRTFFCLLSQSGPWVTPRAGPSCVHWSSVECQHPLLPAGRWASSLFFLSAGCDYHTRCLRTKILSRGCGGSMKKSYKV